MDFSPEGLDGHAADRASAGGDPWLVRLGVVAVSVGVCGVTGALAAVGLWWGRRAWEAGQRQVGTARLRERWRPLTVPVAAMVVGGLVALAVTGGEPFAAWAATVTAWPSWLWAGWWMGGAAWAVAHVVEVHLDDSTRNLAALRPEDAEAAERAVDARAAKRAARAAAKTAAPTVRVPPAGRKPGGFVLGVEARRWQPEAVERMLFPSRPGVIDDTLLKPGVSIIAFGESGSGKSITQIRLALSTLARPERWRVVIVDAKGGPDAAISLAAMSQWGGFTRPVTGVAIGTPSGVPLTAQWDGFRVVVPDAALFSSNPAAAWARAGRAWERQAVRLDRATAAEPTGDPGPDHFNTLRRNAHRAAVHALAPDGVSFGGVMGALGLPPADLQAAWAATGAANVRAATSPLPTPADRRQAAEKVEDFARTAGHLVSGAVHPEDFDLVYVSLPVGVGSQADLRAAAWIVADLIDFLKASDGTVRTLLVTDELHQLGEDVQGMMLTAMTTLRASNVATVISTQHPENFGSEVGPALLANAQMIWTGPISGDLSPLGSVVGVKAGVTHAIQTGLGGATGAGSMRAEAEFVLPLQQIRKLQGPTQDRGGEMIAMRRGCAAKVVTPRVPASWFVAARALEDQWRAADRAGTPTNSTVHAGPPPPAGEPAGALEPGPDPLGVLGAGTRPDPLPPAPPTPAPAPPPPAPSAPWWQ